MTRAEEQALKNHTFIGLGFYEIERLKKEFLAGYKQAEKDLMEKARQWFTDNLSSEKVQLLWCDFEKFISDDNKKTEVIKPIFTVGDEVYHRWDKSLDHVIIESIDETTYYGDTTNFDIVDQDKWGIVRSCENCKCGTYKCRGSLGKNKEDSYPIVSCYLHKDCAGDEPIIIFDDEFVETAKNCREFEQED